MGKLNCWQMMNCGREMGGLKAYKLGVCPASVEVRLDGVHEGDNGGRACWVVADTLCEGIPQGSFTDKYRDCARCDFYTYVRKQEGPSAAINSDLLIRLE